MINQVKQLLLAVSCILFVSASATYAQDDPTWTYPVTHKSFYSFQDDWGNVIVSEDGGLKSLNALTGEVQWELEKDSKSLRVQNIESTPLYIVMGSGLRIIDFLTGEVLLEDKGGDIDYKKHEVFFEKNKVIVDYKKDKVDKVAVADLTDFTKSIIAEVKTKGGFFSKNLRMPSDNGVIFRNKKILNCLDTEGSLSEYDAKVKSIKIIGGTKNGTAVVALKYKTFRGIDIATCTQKWEYTTEKSQFYKVSDEDRVLILVKGKKLIAIDMDSGKELYTYEPGYRLSNNVIFVDGYMVLDVGVYLKKFDIRTGEVVHEVENRLWVEDIQQDGEEYILITNEDRNFIDFNTLEPQFDKGLNGSIAWRGNDGTNYYYVIQLEDGLELCNYEGNSTLKWKKGIKGTIFKDAFVTDKGPAIATERRFALYDEEEGDYLWKYHSKYNIAVAPNKDGSRYYGIVDRYSFYIDTHTGEYQAMPKFKLQSFDVNETQSHIKVFDNTYMMKSGNNFYVRGLEGEEILTKHYKRHSNKSRLLSAASTALAVGAIATGNGKEVVKITDGSGTVHQGSLYETGKFAKSFEDARRRIVNSSDLNLPFVFTKNELKKKVFVFLDPNTGEEYKEIEVKEEEPTYDIDNFEGILFYHNKKQNRLEAHMLNKD